MFGRVLVANRGEIAVLRNSRPTRYENPQASPSSRMSTVARCTFAWPTKPSTTDQAPSAESYLRVDRILEAAKKHGAEAIHPGYGFT